MKKMCVCILFGGISTEHTVSMQSALNVIQAIDKKKFKVFLIGIDKRGSWYLYNNFSLLYSKKKLTFNIVNKLDKKKIFFNMNKKKYQLCYKNDTVKYLRIDVFFPLLHGGLGENGSLQGLLSILNIPFVGSGVLSSAISFNKEISKQLLNSSGLNITPFFSLKRKDTEKFNNIENIVKKFSFPLFIKPINNGSSIGVSKAYNFKELKTSIDLAFNYDDKILIEKAIIGKEIECAVLGNENPIASICGEIVTKSDFYNYESKYCASKTKILIPANISPLINKKIQVLSIKIFKILECNDIARVDFFLSENKIFFNEINTLPGFTKNSIYPLLWEKNNKFTLSQLITKIINVAIKRYKSNNKIKNFL